MNLLAIGLIIIIAGLLMVIGFLAMELDRLTGEHAARARLSRSLRKVPAFRRHEGHHQASPAASPAGGNPYPPVPAAQVASLDDQAHQAGEPYVEPPRGRHARRLPLTEQVIPTPRVGTQPWETAPFAVVPGRPAEEPTNEQTRELYHAPGGTQESFYRTSGGDWIAVDGGAPGVTESVSAWRPDAITYGQACEADVLEGERLAEVMQP